MSIGVPFVCPTTSPKLSAVQYTVCKDAIEAFMAEYDHFRLKLIRGWSWHTLSSRAS